MCLVEDLGAAWSRFPCDGSTHACSFVGVAISPEEEIPPKAEDVEVTLAGRRWGWGSWDPPALERGWWRLDIDQTKEISQQYHEQVSGTPKVWGKWEKSKDRGMRRSQTLLSDCPLIHQSPRTEWSGRG